MWTLPILNFHSNYYLPTYLADGHCLLEILLETNPPPSWLMQWGNLLSHVAGSPESGQAPAETWGLEKSLESHVYPVTIQHLVSHGPKVTAKSQFPLCLYLAAESGNSCQAVTTYLSHHGTITVTKGMTWEQLGPTPASVERITLLSFTQENWML